MKGLFGDLFDFNGDGELDDFERAVAFEEFMAMTEDDEANDDDDFLEGDF